MIVLVSLILFGTITMINLFIAVIISDIKNLETEVFSCNLNNMAQCTILAEAILPAVLLKGLKIERKKNFAPHVLNHQLYSPQEFIGNASSMNSSEGAGEFHNTPVYLKTKLILLVIYY